MKRLIILVTVALLLSITAFLPISKTRAAESLPVERYIDSATTEYLPIGVNYTQNIIWSRETSTGDESVSISRIDKNKFRFEINDNNIQPDLKNQYPVNIYKKIENFEIEYIKLTEGLLYKGVPDFKDLVNVGLYIPVEDRDMLGFDNTGISPIDVKKTNKYNITKYEGIFHLNIINPSQEYILHFGNTEVYTSSTDTLTITGGTEGTPITWGDVYDSDTGATDGRELLDGTIDADPDTFSLDSQPSPMDDLAVPLKIACTARVGATCDIDGTDAWGNAVSENNIDISAGTATTTQRFKTVDANGVHNVINMINGDDLDINQDRWGIISESGFIDIESYFVKVKVVHWGDGVVETWFASEKEAVHLSPPVSGFVTHKIKEDAHLRCGVLVDAGEHQTKDGSAWYWDYGVTMPWGDEGSYLELYGSTWFNNYITLGWSYTNQTMYNSEIQGMPLWVYAVVDCYNVVTHDTVYGLFTNRVPANFEKITIYDTSSYGVHILSSGSTPLTLKDISIKDYTTYSLRVWNSADRYMLDCSDDVFESVSIGEYDYGDTATYRQYSVNIKVVDEEGNAINGATVTLEDGTGFRIFSVSTAADGTITEQKGSHTSWRYTGGDTVIATFNPHTLTITYDNFFFDTVIFDIDEPIDWIVGGVNMGGVESSLAGIGVVLSGFMGLIYLIPLIIMSVLAFWKESPVLFMLAFGLAWVTGLNAPDIISGNAETTTLGLTLGIMLIGYGMFCALMSFRLMFWESKEE